MEKEISEELQKRFEEDVLVILLEVLKKQMPYKPKEYMGYPGKCRCGAVFLDKSSKYCGNCGQRLSWEDTK